MGFQETFKAMSDKTRREILQLLKDKEMSAGDISSRFDMTNATISHHLGVLKDCGLINDRRDGKYIIYELNTSVVEELMTWLIDLRGANNEKK